MVTFLVIYALLLTAILIAAQISRGRTCAGRTADASELDRYDVAMLNGGPPLVVAVALLHLDRDGAVELGDRLLRELASEYDFDPEDAAFNEDQLACLGIDVRVTLSRPIPADAHRVEAAVYRAVEASSTRRADEISAAARSDPAIDQVRARLVQLGLMVDPFRRTLLRRRWRWFLPLAVLGLVGLYLSPDGDRPWMLGLLAATAGAMLLIRSDVPARTSSGSQILHELRGEQPELASASHPLESQDAGMLLALLGPTSLWDADPPLARAVGIPDGEANGWDDDSHPTRRGRTGGWTRWAGDGCGSRWSHHGCGSGGCGVGSGHGCGSGSCGAGGGCGGGGCGAG